MATLHFKPLTSTVTSRRELTQPQPVILIFSFYKEQTEIKDSDLVGTSWLPKVMFVLKP